MINATLYGRDDVPDVLSVSGQMTCRAELEGLPDVSLPLTGLKAAHVEVSSFHHCVQASEPTDHKQTLVFQLPLGNVVLMHFRHHATLILLLKGSTNYLWYRRMKVLFSLS
jgi:AP-5 complex subunit mu-1